MKIDKAALDKIDSIKDRNEKVYKAALYYISQGIPVLPIPYGERFVSDKDIYNKFSKNKAKIVQWFDPEKGINKGWNIAIGCGDYFGKGGVFAVDVDVKYHKKYGDRVYGVKAFERLVQEHGKVYGPVQRTPSGGFHVLMNWQPNCTPSQNKIELGIDTRGGHEGKISSHIMAFPSVADGVQYVWEEGGDVLDVPPWIMEIMGTSWSNKTAAVGGGAGRGNEAMDAEDMEEVEPFERIKTALYSFKAEDLDYTEWVKCGQAIHSQYPGDDGLELWEEWSKMDKRVNSGYKPGDCSGRWTKFGQGKGVRISTLYYITKQYGTLPPNPKRQDSKQADREEAVKVSEDEPIIQDIIDEYNSEYGLVLSGEKAKVVRKEIDIDTNQNIYRTYNIDAFKMFLANDKIIVQDDKGNPKPVKKFDIWMASPKRRTFDGMIMRPDLPNIVDLGNHQMLNTWAGFAVEPEEGDWSLMRNHIFKFLCSENQEHFDWLIDWIADMLQNPHDPKGCAVILGGKEGTGKGTLANAIAKIFGIHGTIISNSSHLTSQYNSMIMDSVFLFADEVVYGGNHDAANRLKAMVSETKNTREQKFGDQKQVRTFLHVMMASNNHWKIAAGPDSRRWFVLEVNSSMASNRDYFGAIKRQMDGGGYQAMLHDMLNRDIVSNLRLAPITQELMHQRALMSVQNTFESLPSWVAHVLATGQLGARDASMTEVDDKEFWPTQVSKKDLWEVYAKWSKEYKPRATVLAITIFSMRLQELGFKEGGRSRTNSGRARTYIVPSFDDFAKAAQKEYAIEIIDNFPEEDENEEM